MASRKYRASLSKAPPKLNSMKNTGRRTSLPAVCPDNSHVGLMTILYNNIGKDLSRVSMPAALNEPVCLLQRLCEELEYSDLLDTANQTDDPYQRMVILQQNCTRPNDHKRSDLFRKVYNLLYLYTVMFLK